MSERLTDADLAHFERSTRAGITVPDRETYVRIADALAELRSLRALLATPMPCGWPEPFVAELTDGSRHVEWPALDEHIDNDEAIALGAALIRAGRKAQGE